jgi:hypothetical protein
MNRTGLEKLVHMGQARFQTGAFYLNVISEIYSQDAGWKQAVWGGLRGQRVKLTRG